MNFNWDQSCFHLEYGDNFTDSGTATGGSSISLVNSRGLDWLKTHLLSYNFLSQPSQGGGVFFCCAGSWSYQHRQHVKVAGGYDPCVYYAVYDLGNGRKQNQLLQAIYSTCIQQTWRSHYHLLPVVVKGCTASAIVDIVNDDCECCSNALHTYTSEQETEYSECLQMSGGTFILFVHLQTIHSMY